MENQVTPVPLIYTSDRGDRYKIAAMQTSHLINVIGHHLGQRETLLSLHNAMLNDRVRMLEDLVAVLTEELLKREVSLDEYLSRLAP